jgi:hypothetical protein
MLMVAQAVVWAAWAEWICNPFDSVEDDQEATLMRGFLFGGGSIPAGVLHSDNR